MKYITTFDTVFLCLTLLQLLECYVRVRISIYHHYTDQAERYQKLKRPLELFSVLGWVPALAFAGSISFEGMTTFILFSAAARTIFVLIMLHYNDKKNPELGELF